MLLGLLLLLCIFTITIYYFLLFNYCNALVVLLSSMRLCICLHLFMNWWTFASIADGSQRH